MLLGIPACSCTVRCGQTPLRAPVSPDRGPSPPSSLVREAKKSPEALLTSHSREQLGREPRWLQSLFEAPLCSLHTQAHSPACSRKAPPHRKVPSLVMEPCGPVRASMSDTS